MQPASIRYHFGREAEIDPELISWDRSSAAKAGKMIAEAENLVVIYGSDGMGITGFSGAFHSLCAITAKNRPRSENQAADLYRSGNMPTIREPGILVTALMINLEKVISTADAVYIAGADPAGDNPGFHDMPSGEAKFCHCSGIIPDRNSKTGRCSFPGAIHRSNAKGHSPMECAGCSDLCRYWKTIAGTRADFLVTAQVRQKVVHSNLEIGSAGQMFMVMASHVPDYHDLTYAKLAETVDQRPIIGRSDLYYGGTSYENRQGLGKQLSTAAVRSETVTYTGTMLIGTMVLPDPRTDVDLLALPISVSVSIRRPCCLNIRIVGRAHCGYHLSS